MLCQLQEDRQFVWFDFIRIMEELQRFLTKGLIADLRYFMASMGGWKHTSTLTILY